MNEKPIGVELTVYPGKIEPGIPTDALGLLEYCRCLLEDRWRDGGQGISFLVFADDHTYQVIPDSTEPKLQPAIQDGMARLIKRVGAKRFVYVLEGWVGPERREMLMLGAVYACGGCAVGHFDIVRDQEGHASLQGWTGGLEDVVPPSWACEIFDIEPEVVH